MAQKIVQLSAELATVQDAVEAVRILLDQARMGGLAVKDDDLLADHVASAVLSLVIERIRLLTRVVRGDVDARLIWALHNATETQAPGEDIYLVAGPNSSGIPTKKPRKKP